MLILLGFSVAGAKWIGLGRGGSRPYILIILSSMNTEE